MRVMQSAYLNISEVALELEISSDGVYKLIKRGKLPAVRRSERGMRVSRISLDAYKHRLQHGDVAVAIVPEISRDGEDSCAGFVRETGLHPSEWTRRWKADELDDSAENMRLTLRALSLLVDKRDKKAA
jgi:excisionase family DNA binding protein